MLNTWRSWPSRWPVTESSEATKNVGLLGDADKTVEVYVAKSTGPYEVNPPGRNKLHSFIQVVPRKTPQITPKFFRQKVANVDLSALGLFRRFGQAMIELYVTGFSSGAM
jgi:hypothetical protein